MRSMHCLAIVAVVTLVVCVTETVQAAGPLKEKGLTAMVDAGFDEAEIIAKIKKDGVDFALDDAMRDRLKAAGVTDAVLAELKRAAVKPAPAAKPSVTFESVLSLLENGVEPDLIIARVRKAAATFVLSAKQEQQLRAAGATDALIAAMKSGEKDADTAEPISDLAIVLDVSGSMKEPTTDGPSKIEVAREVVGELVEKIPTGLNVTLIVYGHRAGCSAVQTLRPLSELSASDKQSLISAVAGLQAVGNTPIALALRRTGEQFAGRKSYCGVVLITDGLESCKGDPAAEAATLAENPFLRFGVNVVGFGLKAEENDATAAIAAAGKGKYYAVADREELLSAINDVTKKLEKGAKPAPIAETAKKGRRAIVILKPEVEYPAVKEICTVKLDARYYTVNSYKLNSVDAYGKEIRQASAKPVDVWLVPVEGLPIRLAAKFENKEREVRELRLEDLAGLVRVSSKEGEFPEAMVAITPADSDKDYTVENYKIQAGKGYNKDLIVPAGAYNVWVKNSPDDKFTLLEQDVEIVPGEVTPVER